MATTSIVVKDVASCVCEEMGANLAQCPTHTQAANNTMHAGSVVHGARARAEDELRYDVLVILIEMFRSPNLS